MSSKKRRSRLIAFGLGLAGVLLVAEIALRFMPVSTPLRPAAVNAEHPVFKYEPDRSFVFSRDWNFAVANKGRINNDGFVNDSDYVERDDPPLLAVIGDSFIEAAMVPYAETVQARLAKELEGRARVYSFAASGAPLSQYLVWAEYARDKYAPAALAIAVVGNDFDESLASVSICPGQHHFVPNERGELELRRFDYEPGTMGRIVYASALARYVNLNLRLATRVKAMKRSIFGPATSEGTETFVGNTWSRVTPERLAQSDQVIDTFLRLLPEKSGLPSTKILFVLDGMRPELYDENALAAASPSYFATMRDHFTTKARALGYEVVDLQPRFIEQHRRDGSRFEFPTDYHWNGNGHAVVAHAIQSSAVFESVRR
jgi:hypothetical protein